MMQPQQKPADQKAVETYRKLGLAAMKIIYDPKIAPQIVTIMQKGNPAQGIAQAVFVVILRMQEGVKGANPNVVFAVAPAVAAMVAEIGKAAGVLEPTPQMVAEALKIVAQQAGQQAPQGAPQQPAQQPAPQQPAQPMGVIQKGAM